MEHLLGVKKDLIIFLLIAAFSVMSQPLTASAQLAAANCEGSCGAPECPYGYKLGSSTCDCSNNGKCACGGTVTCNPNDGKGGTKNPACEEDSNNMCRRKKSFESETFGDPITVEPLASRWGPRLEEGCTQVY